MCTFCFSSFAADFFCFFAFAAGFFFCLAFCSTDHYRSRTILVYFQELIRAITTAPTIISSASARMCFTFLRFCSPLYNLSIHQSKLRFRSMFYATKQLPLEKILHIRILYLALTYTCHACVHACACERDGHYF